ncbi:RNA polymerase II associated Paf1 complex component PAF1 [Toxoplasma gondii TgCatPRC2]|uniref:RNA polymerase II associated Paf1 complex component PAF1 n=1 Tax=Toxoplasma gondii TgCatPRC2 TaxID=1130821 RepID=A0A151H3T6_TOXGO|nr:RNA polymerase II associated Paf1 complex component PAF1 [Toxoplasma gondii TgCatPRC2]
MRQTGRPASQATGAGAGEDRPSGRRLAFVPSRNFRPSGSLAYLQTKSLYLYSPSFQVPLPRIPLAPKFCAYPFSREAICGKPPAQDAASKETRHLTRQLGAAGGNSIPLEEVGEETGANVFDVVASLQLLQEFDVAGILPNLINPKGYPNLLAVPPLAAPPVVGGSGVRTAGKGQASAPFSLFQHLPAEDFDIVSNVLPELALHRMQQARLSKREGEKGKASEGTKSRAPGGTDADRAGAFEAAGLYRHPTQPHLKPKRIFSVVPHRRLCGNDYLPVGIDLPAEVEADLEKEATGDSLFLDESGETGDRRSLAAGATRQMPPAVLLVNEATKTSVSYGFYTKVPESETSQVKREEGEAADKAAETLNAKYRFSRFYSSHMLAKDAGAPTENSFLLFIPNASSAVEEAQGASPPREELAFVVPLHSQRRILVKAGGSARRPRLSLAARVLTKEEEEDREARRAAACGREPGKRRVDDMSGEDEGSGSDASLRDTSGEEASDGGGDSSETGRKRRRQSPEAAEPDGESGGQDALFAHDEEEEREASTSSSSSSSDSSSSGSEDDGEEDSSESSNEEDEE